jgi:thiosulfate dehydrogenase
VRRPYSFLLLSLLMIAAACSRSGAPAPSADSKSPLISAKTTMMTAWDFPRNPLTAKLDNSKLSTDIIWGFRIFTNTPGEVPHLAPGKISCNNCHLNGGQREKSLPLVGVAGMFPEYNRRAGRLYTLADRIVDCFVRSENGTGVIEAEGQQALPTPTSKEVLAVAAYITWLAEGTQVGKNPSWRGQNTIAQANLIPIEKLDRARGEALFKQHCVNCHGENGQGVQIGDKKAGPLWGPDSWNDGAGAARVYTLAGIIRYAMPYLYPGGLTDEEAQQIAAYIDSQPRPSYPFKDSDYRVEKLPVDSLYYAKRAQ